MRRDAKKVSVFLLRLVILLILSAGIACSTSRRKFRNMHRGMPYGSKIEVEFSKYLWKALEKSRLVGENSFNTTPRSGEDPHGVVVETLSGKVKVLGGLGQVYVQKNYLGREITRTRVAKLREKYLQSISVMYKREHTYDPANKNWFWAEFTPRGEIRYKVEKLPAAGRVARGEKQGCINCHAGAPGGDYVFSNTAMRLEKDRH